MNATLVSSLSLVVLAEVAAAFEVAEPVIAVDAESRRLRFLNAAAAKLLGIVDVAAALGHPVPFEEPVERHLARVLPGLAADGETTERVRFYRGIKPVVVTIKLRRLTSPAGEAIVVATLPDARTGTFDLEATLDLYAQPDQLLTIFNADDILAVAGDTHVLDGAQQEIEAMAEQDAGERLERRRVRVSGGSRNVLIVRVAGTALVRRLLHVGPLEAVLPDEPATDDDVAAGFRFDLDGKPHRFAWQIDASGRVVGFGPELAASLGPHVVPETGDDWQTFSDHLCLDPEGSLAGALSRRSAWQGIALDWPIEGTALRASVELAGMPVSERTRGFAGYRGFGIVRPATAKPDALLTGLIVAKAHAAETPPDDEPVLDANELAMAEAAIGRAPLVEPVAAEPPVAAASADAPEQSAAAEAEIAEAELPAESRPAEAADVEPMVEPEPIPGPKTLATLALVASNPVADFRSDDLPRRPVTQISPETLRLSSAERNAFRQIAEALGARFEGDEEEKPAVRPAPRPAEVIAPSEPEASMQSLIAELDGRTSAGTQAAHLVDRLPVAVGIISGDALIYINDAFLKLTGYASLADLSDRGGLDALFAGPHAGKDWTCDSSKRPIPLITREGRVLPAEVRIVQATWAGANALVMTMTPVERSIDATIDATAKAAIEALAGARARMRELEAIIDTATDGVVILDAAGRIASANRAAEKLFGLARGEMDGRHLSMLMVAESRRGVFDLIDAIGRGIAHGDGREMLGQVRPEGQIPLIVTLGRISADLAAETKYCAVIRDIREWKRSEEELTAARRRAEESSLQKTDFLAKISHEIRTPLNAIIGFSEVMLGERFGAVGSERYKDYLRDIQSSGTHIMSLVNDLLDLSKVEAGKMDLKFEPVQLGELLGDCIALMQPQANRERIIIRSSLPAGLPAVAADQRSVKQIMLNLLSNAIKFTPAGGQVIVSAVKEETGEVVIRVRDTGFGMSESDIQLALEPFRQLHTDRGRGGGTGLGLPLTKALVEANRAAMRIDSAVNQGTLVQVTFPVARVLPAA
ncbi:MAG: PAS domain-containing sensor histidine kinase [Ancalomicrobiaceae bacterium]|nr:PAS domain-containing sensor histidine kinase [Ancalomicrobiaceae bacterium]